MLILEQASGNPVLLIVINKVFIVSRLCNERKVSFDPWNITIGKLWVGRGVARASSAVKRCVNVTQFNPINLYFRH